MAKSEHVDDRDEDDIIGGDSNGLQWVLGFVEPDATQPPTSLLRHRFVSKVGGRPAWLHPVDLPTPQQLQCPLTHRTMPFLLQIYAALPEHEEAASPDAFHRVIYVFISPCGAKLHVPHAVRAFRCQLPQNNPFYAPTAATAADVVPQRLADADHAASLQRDPWRAVEYEACLAEKRAVVDVADVACFLEMELINEAEDDGSVDDDANTRELLARYVAQEAAEGALTEHDLPSDVVRELENQTTPEQRHYAAFAAIVAKHPEQVLRYCIDAGAEPLWPNPQPRPASIPPCEWCGAPRRFEFQIMPQLLNFLAVSAQDTNAPDFGTIAVYTCSRSCSRPSQSQSDASDSYAPEFVYVQPSDAQQT